MKKSRNVKESEDDTITHALTGSKSMSEKKTVQRDAER